MKTWNAKNLAMTMIIAISCIITTNTYAQTNEVAVTQYTQLKTLLSENATKKEGMYEYDLNFKFVVKSWGISKQKGKASVIGRNRISSAGTSKYFELTNDKLDQALKQILITADDTNGVYTDIIFSVNEWEKQGSDRGSEGAQLRITKNKETGAPVVYVRENTELVDAKGTIVSTDKQISITYQVGKTTQNLTIERNATLDMTLAEVINGVWVKLGTYTGGAK